MVEIQNSKKYDLEERTFIYAQNIRRFVRKLSRDIVSTEDIPQLIRSSGSIGANYIEANESISKKDFIHRIKIARKEAKESRFWLKLIEANNSVLESERLELITEATELMFILSSIMRKFESPV